VDEVGFHSRGNSVALDIPWEVIDHAQETDLFFLFYYGKQCAYYIPKRALSLESTGELRELLRAHLGIKAVISQ
jgi:hypothetical protein